MFGFKDYHIKLMWVLAIAFIIFGILPMVIFAINPDRQSLLRNNIFTDQPDPSSVAFAADEPATERNPDTGTIKGLKYDGQPGTSFQIDWYKDGAIKYTSTVHYGYIDQYGRYHQDSLPAMQTNNVSKDCVSESIITSNNSNIAYGTYSSFFDIDQYSQTINYNDTYYSLYGCYFGNTPNQPTAYKLSKMTFDYDSSERKFYYINKWYNDGDFFYQENSTNPKWATSTPASNNDIYIAFKEQPKDDSGKLDATENGFKAHWKWTDDGGAKEKVLQFRYAHKVWNSSTSSWDDELLPSQFAGDVYIATFNNMPDTSSEPSYSNKKFVNIYDYVGKFINYAGQNYVYDYAQCCDTGNPRMEEEGILEAIGYQPSWSGTHKWCWGTRDLLNNYKQGWTWNRGEGWKDEERYFRTTIYFNDTNSSEDLTREKPTRGNQIVNDTVNSADDGVDLKLFDYDAWNDSTDPYKRYTNTGINKNNVFKFSKGTFSEDQEGLGTQGGVKYWFNQYDYMKYGWAVHDIFGKLFDYENNNPVLKDLIYDGKPNGTDLYDDLTSVDKTQKDMKRFFDANDTFDGHKRNICNLNHLFTKDSNGYYQYDSSTNFAQLPKYINSNTSNAIENTNNFVLYNSANKTSNARFMPFDSKDISPTIDRDYLFGMTMEFDFNQPDDGQVSSQDMIFEFHGDDDVMVYIDGVQILNLAGLHQSLYGTINFATGTVEQAATIEEAIRDDKDVSKEDPGQYTVTHTFKDIFREAGKIDHEIWDNKSDPKTFKNGSRHNLKFIYFERGMGDSNCKMRFNIPPVPEKDLEIGKSTTETPNVLKTGESGNDAKSKLYTYYVDKYNLIDDKYYPYKGTAQIYAGVVGGTHTTKLRDEPITNGIVKIKEDEVAVVKGFWTGEEYGTYEVLEEINSVDDAEKKWGVSIECASGEIEYTTKGIEITEDESTKTVIAKGCTNINFPDANCPGFQFKNDLYLYNLELRNDTNQAKTVKVMFGNSDNPFKGTYKKGASSYTSEDGIITFDGEESITIEKVEQDTPVKIVNASTDPYDTFVEPSPPDAYKNLKIHDATLSTDKVTAITWAEKFDPSTPNDNISRFNFKLEAGGDLTIKKEIKPTLEEEKQFKIICNLYNSTKTKMVSDKVYEATFKNKEGTTSDIKIKIDNGEIKEFKPSVEPYLFDIKLGDQESISIPAIVPPNGWFDAAEPLEDSFWPSGKLMLNGSTNNFDFTYDDDLKAAKSDIIQLTKSEDGAYDPTIDITNRFNVAPTGFNIADTLFIFVILLAILLLIGGPIKAYRMYKQHKV